MTGLVSRLDKRWYPEHGSNWDDELFRQRLLVEIDSSTSVLELGAGAGIVEQMDFRGVAGKVCGIDPDERVVSNAMLHEARVGMGEKIPYDDETFDIVFADNVLEHLGSPEVVFAEVSRVLKPGGSFLFKTPNVWHYMPLISRLTPHSFHRYINRKRGRKVEDTFPTCYKANSRKQIYNLVAGTPLRVDYVDLIEGRPEYMRMSAVTYIFGWMYERVVNSNRFLQSLRILLVGKLTKSASSS